MRVIKPIPITSAMVVSSTVPEGEQPTYVAATNYAVGVRVIYDRAVYESVQTPNTGKTPDIFPLFWAKISSTNRWAMFDTEVSTLTSTTTSPLTVTVAPSALFDSLAFFNVTATMLSVTIRDGATGPIVYSYSQSLDGVQVLDWYQYFYARFRPTRQVVLTGLPLYGSAHVTISFTGGGTISCGSVVMGLISELGETQYGASVGIIDFSRKETNAVTGNTTFVKRKNSRRLDARVVVDNFELSRVFQELEDLRATPCVWVGTKVAGLEPLTVFGFYRDFSVEITYSTESMCSLQIEGLT